MNHVRSYEAMSVQEMAREAAEQHNALASQRIVKAHGLPTLARVWQRMSDDHGLTIGDALAAEIKTVCQPETTPMRPADPRNYNFWCERYGVQIANRALSLVDGGTFPAEAIHQARAEAKQAEQEAAHA